uniref:Ubiquitin carboxyl-terminal hydrolase n=1 Tax=Timema douglasi TaxID=61478 RepID=A0A7R8Z499_TIMDO|nr:unnamed protein product [Timema douglasi]
MVSLVLTDSSQLTSNSQHLVCFTSLNPWLCLHCGNIGCGRYVNGHAKEHCEQSSDHCLCMDCDSLAIYCYTCDEFVANDTNSGMLEQLRRTFVRSHSGSQDLEDDTLSDGDKGREKGGLWKSNKEIRENVRTLRPRSRKRSHSADSSGENRQYKCQRGNSSGSKSRDKKVVGLRNLGNTCFMNAVLQSLSNIQEFCHYIKQLPSLENSGVGVNGRRIYHSRSYREMNEALMAEELRKVLINLSQGGNKGAISPESLFLVIWKVVPRFRGYQQQDAHEFLRYMLDRLHTELLHLLPDFTLKDNPYISLGHKSTSSIVTTVFGDCLTSFIEVEELADTELYYCNNCKSKQKSTKRFWIRRLPNVLCLHLKRFRWNNFFRTKIDTNILFPVTALDMSQFVLSNLHETRRSGTGSNLYDLAAVIVHHGSGAGSGHYTAFAVNDGQWFHFNDSTVRPTELQVVAKCKPYILFYIRREFRLPHLNS